MKLKFSQRIRKICRRNYYLNSGTKGLAYFNGIYIMDEGTAKENLGNKKDPHEWEVEDFIYLSGSYDNPKIVVDFAARLRYCEEFRKEFLRSSKKQGDTK